MNESIKCLLLLVGIGYLPQVLSYNNKWTKAFAHPDIHLNITQLIDKYGYPVESHHVTTEDGYKLEIFRIPHGKKGFKPNERPMLLFTGLLGQAEHTVIAASYNSSKAFHFADQGYDVWLGNNRGSGHGLKHVTLSSDDKEFWNFSYHEIGYFDLPAIIDYISSITEDKGLFYVAHSQGGRIFYILTSSRPEYQKKIIAAVLLSPSGYEKHFSHPLFSPLATQHRFLKGIFEAVNLYRVPPPWLRFENIFAAICSLDIFGSICDFLAASVVGVSGQTDWTILPLVLHSVEYVSMKLLLHYAQSMVSGHFRPWDYGETKNLEIYGSTEPPEYPLEKIVTPVFIFYTLGDVLVRPEDIQIVCAKLQHCKTFEMAVPNWSHFDFAFSKNLYKFVIAPILKLLRPYKF